MKIGDVWRATQQWAPFAVRTVGFGTISLLFGPLTENHRASLFAMRKWCQQSIAALNIAVDVEGLENVPKEAAFVYCSNHQSIVDIIVLGSVLPGDYKWAAKRSLMRIPFLGWHLKLAGHVPVDRGRGSQAAAEVINRFEAVLRRGNPLLIFPEGTRSRDGALQPLKNGAFFAAVRAGVPVVPVILDGTYQMMKKGATDTGEVNTRVVKVRIGKPIQAMKEGKERFQVPDLRERTHAAMAALPTSIGGRVAAVAGGCIVQSAHPSDAVRADAAE